MVGSFAFVCIFLGYSFALIYRSIDHANPGSAPLAVIPFVISVLPAIRFASLLPRKAPRK